ncbi:hypothetical protein P4H61_07520 [Paenibacillus peoriae]|uniref:hypothetical protein n=1 Tax=Paenibacillus peoriae TaxID=59893 RepID=UPI00026C5A11|nr:hypothetical protein [Paenibacillus peoriae]MEC0181348.1 hypothetical protein [Paenibacillus peoriae]
MVSFIQKADKGIMALTQFIKDSHSLTDYKEANEMSELNLKPGNQIIFIESANTIFETVVMRILRNLKDEEYPLLGIRSHLKQEPLIFSKFCIYNGTILIGRIDLYMSRFFKEIEKEAYVEITFDKRKNKASSLKSEIIDNNTSKKLLKSISKHVIGRHNGKIFSKYRTDVTEQYAFKTKEFSELTEILNDIIATLIEKVMEHVGTIEDLDEAILNNYLLNLREKLT